MKLPQTGYRHILTAVLFACVCPAVLADEPRTADDSAPHAHDHFLYVEPGPTVEATRDCDGVTEQVATNIEWKPICGSDMGDMTPEQFAEFIRDIKTTAANAHYEVLDNPTPQGPGFNLVFSVSGASADATAAIAAVETYIESLFSDPITVNISITFQSLSPGVIGATGSANTQVAYSSVRTSLINGMDGNDTLQTFLPTGSVPVNFDGASSTVTNVTTITVNTANYRAFIGNIGGTDANMSINTNFTFDYDPSNGITSGQTCFRSVLVHEVMHALGFVSEGDGSGTTDIKTLDIFRFRRTQNNPSTTAEFTTFPRAVWTSNRIADDVNSDFVSAEYRMSWGGSGNYQASHWRDQGGVPGSAVGIMNPAIASSVTWAPNYMRTSDLAAMDAIGWDHPAVIVDTTPPTPNPMQFNNLPSAVDNQSITMMSVIATDTQNNSITYYFDYVGLLPGGDDSGWQGSIVYTDTGLTENTSYTYRVKARDSASTPNETLYSPTAAAITHMTTPTGVNVSNLTPTSATISAAGTLTNLNLGSSGVFLSWVLTAGGAPVGDSGWIQVNSHNVTGLSPDTMYTFRAKARNQESVETATNQAFPVRTLAFTPGAPSVTGGALAIDTNGNPPTVLYAIQCISTVPNDPVWLNKFVDGTGMPSAFEDYNSSFDWVLAPLQNLTNGVTYQFAAKAVNGDFVETPLGPPVSLTPGGTSVHADCNGDGVFNVVTDTACFVDVLLGVNTDPGAITRSDVSGDAVTNGLDIAYFVDCALNGCP